MPKAESDPLPEINRLLRQILRIYNSITLLICIKLAIVIAIGNIKRVLVALRVIVRFFCILIFYILIFYILIIIIFVRCIVLLLLLCIIVFLRILIIAPCIFRIVIRLICINIDLLDRKSVV